MKRWVFGFGLCALLGSASAQEVWKCEVDGVVRYTDQPCGGQGHPVLAASPASAASAAPQPVASGAMVTSVSAAPDRSTRRRAADNRWRQSDPLAPMPAGFVQRGNPRAQMVAAQTRAAQVLTPQSPPSQNLAAASPP